jgi:hypothetical protein
MIIIVDFYGIIWNSLIILLLRVVIFTCSFHCFVSEVRTKIDCLMIFEFVIEVIYKQSNVN